MSNMKTALENVLACEDCYGLGYTGWVSPDGDYDFEYCNCNPYKIIIDYDKSVVDTGTLFSTQEAK